MTKRTDATSSWEIWDTSRDSYNYGSQRLYAESSSATGTVVETFDALSNGFKLRGSSGVANASGGSYIYIAFAESPFKYSLAR